MISDSILTSYLCLILQLACKPIRRLIEVPLFNAKEDLKDGTVDSSFNSSEGRAEQRRLNKKTGQFLGIAGMNLCSACYLVRGVVQEYQP